MSIVNNQTRNRQRRHCHVTKLTMVSCFALFMTISFLMSIGLVSSYSQPAFMKSLSAQLCVKNYLTIHPCHTNTIVSKLSMTNSRLFNESIHRKRLLSFSGGFKLTKNRIRKRHQNNIYQSQNDSDESSTPSLSPSTSSTPEQILDKILYKLQNLSPIVQLVILLFSYILHLLVFTQHLILFPFQLIPNNKGWFQSIGLDSVAGIISFISIALLRKRQLKQGRKVTIPSLFSGVYDHKVVDHVVTRTTKKRKQNKYDNDDSDNDEINTNRKKRKKQLSSSPWKFPLTTQNNTPSPRITSMIALALLVTGYFFTGRLSSMVELYLYAMAGLGIPMTIAMHRSLVVLGGHLAWVAIGSGILGFVLRPQPFFGGGNKHFAVEDDTDTVSKNNSVDNDDEFTDIILIKQKYKWFTNKWNSNWLWWTMSGYFISAWFFNIADFLNQLILPAHVFELAGEGVVSQLINPENNDIAASLVGYIAPCITAPWWEEVLYRGFLLPALTLQMKFWPAVIVSGVVFSIHHVSTTGAIPLAILGWTWAALYAKSGNLMVTILIHAMWNSRVFFGSWLGL